MARQPKKEIPRERSNPEKVYVNTQFKPISAKNEAQKKYLSAMGNSTITFGLGPSGTGKSICSMGWALGELFFGRTERIVITRPAVEVGVGLGFLPGTQEEKFGPWIQPLVEISNRCMGPSHTQMLLKDGKLEAVPIPYCRGRSWNDSIILVDEAQNTTPQEMKMLLTRIGYNSKMIVSGDISQKDIQDMSGLEEAIDIIGFIPSVKVIEFSVSDVVRSGICSEIVLAYYQRGR
jgi:phosphate starvation-inducible PhoH-like protein